jgi:type I restriction enzyme, S subunit
MKSSWERGKLADYIQEFIVPQRDKPKFFAGSIPWCRIEDVEGIYLSESKSGKCVTHKVIKEMPLRVFPRETVIVSCSADLGRCAIVSTPLVTNQTFIGLVPKATLSPLFLYYLMTGRADELNAAATGATIKYLSQDKFKALDIAVPPIPEQQRIVRLLGEAVEGIATAKANAEKNRQNARALFESRLNAVFTQRGPGWLETRLGDAYDVRDGTHDSPKYHATGYPLITSKNLKREGLSFDDVRLISEQDYTKINERSAVHRGDVLFAMIGTIGNPTLVEVNPNFAIKNVALFKNPKGQSGAFLKHYLDSGIVISKMMKEAKGTTQKFVGLGYLRKFPINLPPLATQLKLVEELDELTDATRRLESIYQRKLAALDELKKSLLHQAFSGQL